MAVWSDQPQESQGRVVQIPGCWTWRESDAIKYDDNRFRGKLVQTRRIDWTETHTVVSQERMTKSHSERVENCTHDGKIEG